MNETEGQEDYVLVPFNTFRNYIVPLEDQSALDTGGLIKLIASKTHPHSAVYKQHIGTIADDLKKASYSIYENSLDVDYGGRIEFIAYTRDLTNLHKMKLKSNDIITSIDHGCCFINSDISEKYDDMLNYINYNRDYVICFPIDEERTFCSLEFIRGYNRIKHFDENKPDLPLNIEFAIPVLETSVTLYKGVCSPELRKRLRSDEIFRFEYGFWSARGCFNYNDYEHGLCLKKVCFPQHGVYRKRYELDRNVSGNWAGVLLQVSNIESCKDITRIRLFLNTHPYIDLQTYHFNKIYPMQCLQKSLSEIKENMFYIPFQMDNNLSRIGFPDIFSPLSVGRIESVSVEFTLSQDVDLGDVHFLSIPHSI